MPKTPFVDFKAVKAAVTMEQLLQHYGLTKKFKRSGDSLSGPCPIHGGTNPTQFRVSVSKNIWNCFSECKHGGNVLDFIARMEHVDIRGAALKAIEWFKLDIGKGRAEVEESDEETPEPRRTEGRSRGEASSAESEPSAESNMPNRPLKFRLDKLDKKHAYLTQRGLTEETIDTFGVGYCAKGVMAGRIAIPIANSEGEVVAYAGRFPGEPAEDTPKYKLPQGFRKSLELFNADRAFQAPAEMPLVIVEGFFGCMLMHQYGHPKVIALMGATLSEAQETLIRKHTTPKSCIIVLLDEDEAGRIGREDIAIRLSRFAFVRVHVFDEEGLDPECLNADEIAAILE